MKNRIAYGLAWGITMFFLMTFVFDQFVGDELTLKALIINFLLWGVFGSFLFGYLITKKLKF